MTIYLPMIPSIGAVKEILLELDDADIYCSEIGYNIYGQYFHFMIDPCDAERVWQWYQETEIVS